MINENKVADLKPDTGSNEENRCKKCCCTCIVNCPCGYAILTLLCCLLISGGAWIDVAFADIFPHNIETDVSAYIRVAHAQTDVNDAVDAAFIRQQEINNNDPKARRLQETFDNSIDMPSERSHGAFAINFFYQAANTDKHGHNVFTKKHLEEIRKYEKDFRETTGYKEKCLTIKDSPNLCEPGDTIINYMFPTVEGKDYTFDGNGELVSDIDGALVLMYQRDLVFYMDRYFSATNLTSSVTRSTYWFGVPLKGYADVDTKKAEQEAKIHRWLEELHTNFLKKRQHSSEYIRVMWQSNYLQNYEVLLALREDAILASGSLLFVFFYMAFYMCSLSLSAVAITGILLSFPTSYFFYHTVFGNNSMSILNFVALFLILGIGADDCFVFHDTWHHSKYYLLHHNNADENTKLRHRIEWTYKVAGKSMLVTTVTTAASFFANLVSPIQAVADFGLFMGLTVLMNFVIVMTWFPCCLLAIEKCPCCKSCSLCETEDSKPQDGQSGGLEFSQAQLNEDMRVEGRDVEVPPSPPTPGSRRKSTRIVKAVGSALQSMRANMLGASVNELMAPQESSGRIQSLRSSRRLGRILANSVDLNDSSASSLPMASKSTQDMIKDEKDEIDRKLLKQDGYKAMEIGIHNYFSWILYWKRGGAVILVIATLACLVISILRFGAAFKVADRPPQFFDLRHNLGGLEDITSNYFSEAVAAQKSLAMFPTKGSTQFICLTDTDCGGSGSCDTSVPTKHKCTCGEGKKGINCDQNMSPAQLIVNKEKPNEPIKVFFSPSLRTSSTRICIGNYGDYSMDFKLDSSATKTSSSWDVRLQPLGGFKRTIDAGQACETFIVTAENLDASNEWKDSTVVRFLWKATTDTEFSQTTDVEVSAQYNAKPGINSLRLYCAASEIALEPSFERSTDAYRVKVPFSCKSKLAFEVESQFADPSLVSMTFEGADIVQSESRFAVSELAAGESFVANVLIPDGDLIVEAYTVDIEVATASKDASFKQVLILESQDSNPRVVLANGEKQTISISPSAVGVGIRTVPTSTLATWAVNTGAKSADCPGATPLPTTEIKCYQLSSGSTQFEVVVTAEDGQATQKQKFVVAIAVVTCDPSGPVPGVTGGTVNCDGVTAVDQECVITADSSYSCEAAKVKCKAQATTAVYVSEGTCNRACNGEKQLFDGGEADCSSALKTDETCTVKALSGKSCASVKVKCSAQGKYEVSGECTPPCTGTFSVEGATLDCTAADDPGESCTLFALSGWDCSGVSVTCQAEGQDVGYKKGDASCNRIIITQPPAVCTKYDDFNSASSGAFALQMTCDDILLQQNPKYLTCGAVEGMLSAGKDCRGCKCGCNEVAPTVTGANVDCSGKKKNGDYCELITQSGYTCRNVKVKCAASSSKGFFYEVEGTCIKPTPGKCQCEYNNQFFTCDDVLLNTNLQLPSRTCTALANSGSCSCERNIQGCSCGCSNLLTPQFVGGDADCSGATNFNEDCVITPKTNYDCKGKKITCAGSIERGYYFAESGTCQSTLATTAAPIVTTKPESVQVHVNFDLDYEKYKADGGEKAWEDYVRETIAAKFGINKQDVKLVSTYENQGRRQLGTAFVIEINVPKGKDKSQVVSEVQDSFVNADDSPDGTSKVGSVSDADYVCSAKWLSERKNLPDGVKSVSCNAAGACTTTNDPGSDYDCTGVTATCFNSDCIPAGANVCGLRFTKTCIAPCKGNVVIVTGGRIDCSAAKRNGAKCKSAQPIGSYTCDSDVTATCTAGTYVESTKKCAAVVTCNGQPLSYKDFTADCSAARNVNDECKITPLKDGTCDTAKVTCIREGDNGVYKADPADGVCPLQCQPSEYTNTITGADVDCAGVTAPGSECVVTAKDTYTCTGVKVKCSSSNEESKYAVDGSCYLSTTWIVSGAGGCSVLDSDPTCVVSRNFKSPSGQYQSGDECVLKPQVGGSVSASKESSLGSGDTLTLPGTAAFQMNGNNIVQKNDQLRFIANNDNDRGRWQLCLSLPSCARSAKPTVQGASSVNCDIETASYGGGKCTVAGSTGFDCDAVAVTCNGTTDVHVVTGNCVSKCGQGILEGKNGNYNCAAATPSSPNCVVTAATDTDREFDCSEVEVQCLPSGKTETGKCVAACSGKYTTALKSDFPLQNPGGGGTADCSDATAAGKKCRLINASGHTCEGTTISCYADGSYNKVNAGGDADCYLSSCPDYVAAAFLDNILIRQTSSIATPETLNPAFNKYTTNSEFNVNNIPFSTKQVHVQGTWSSSGAFGKCKFSISTASGPVSFDTGKDDQATVPIDSGTTTIFVTVEASKPTGNRVYEINIIRVPPKTDATLKNLGLAQSLLDLLRPSWNPNVEKYDLALENPDILTVTFAPEANDAVGAKVDTNDQGSGKVTVVLPTLDAKPIKIAVTAESGLTVRVYTVSVRRKPKPCPTHEGKQCNDQNCNGLTGECKCDKNYDGQACDAYCPNECSDHGTCNAKEVCTVDIAKENIPQAVLEDIHQQTQISVEDIDCSMIAYGDWLCCHSSNGQQVKDFCCGTCKDKQCPKTETVNATDWGSDCNCQPGWIGADCNTQECPKKDGKICYGHGECQSDYTCKCENGYKGVVCSTLACKKGKLEGSEEEKECYGAGTCVDGECECYQGYSGDACQDKEESKFAVPWTKCAPVQVMWGLNAERGTNNFGRSTSKSIDRLTSPSQLYPNGVPVFDPDFDPRKPEVQIFLYEACLKFHNGTGLRWRGTAKDGTDWCFMEYLRKYAMDKRIDFPVDAALFDELVDTMVRTHHTYFFNLIGRPEGYPNNKDGKSLFFIAMKMKVNMNLRDVGAVSEPVYQAWEKFTEELNAQAPKAAGKMVHSSPAWLLMLVETEAVAGSIQAMAISVGAAFLAVFLFTGNVLVSIYTGMSIVFIVIFLGAFIVAALQWPFGAIESICLTIFVLFVAYLQGFSVDYVLHIAHKYNEAHEYHSSFLKMRQAITSIGPSIISASITTTGSSIFLVFCQIYIFQQMGWLLIVNTVFAIGVAMLTFPSILSLFGPRGRFCDMYKLCSKKLDGEGAQNTEEIEMVIPPSIDNGLVSSEAPSPAGEMFVAGADNAGEFSALPPAPLQHREDRHDDQPMPSPQPQQRHSASNALASFNIYENAYAPVQNDVAAVQNDHQPMPSLPQPASANNNAGASLNVYDNAYAPVEIGIADVQNDEQPIPFAPSLASVPVESDDQPMPDSQPWSIPRIPRDSFDDQPES